MLQTLTCIPSNLVQIQQLKEEISMILHVIEDFFSWYAFPQNYRFHDILKKGSSYRSFRRIIGANALESSGAIATSGSIDQSHIH